VHSIFLYILWHVGIDLKIEYLVAYLELSQQKKYAIGCARILTETGWFSTVSICLTVLRFGVPFTLQILLSARNLTNS